MNAVHTLAFSVGKFLRNEFTETLGGTKPVVTITSIIVIM